MRAFGTLASAHVRANSAHLLVGLRSDRCDPAKGWASCLLDPSSVSPTKSLDQAVTHGGTRQGGGHEEHRKPRFGVFIFYGCYWSVPSTHPCGAERRTPLPVCPPRKQPDETGVESEWPPQLASLFSGNCVVLLIYTELWEASL